MLSCEKRRGGFSFNKKSVPFQLHSDESLPILETNSEFTICYWKEHEEKNLYDYFANASFNTQAIKIDCNWFNLNCNLVSSK